MLRPGDCSGQDELDRVARNDVTKRAFCQATIMSQGVELPSGSSRELGEIKNVDVVSLQLKGFIHLKPLSPSPSLSSPLIDANSHPCDGYGNLIILCLAFSNCFCFYTHELKTEDRS